MNKKITLTLRDPESFEEQELRFEVSTQIFNRFMNASSGKDKVAPLNNFLFDCCHPDDKAALRELVKEDGMSILLSGDLVDNYMPKVTISVKKPESGQKPTIKAK